MKEYLKHDEWSIVEEGFIPEYNRISESIFSIGNGRFGQRANFEEQYSGDTLLGNYLAGIYYPDKTKVGWWKIGYPEYFAKVLNASNWAGINIDFEGEALDLAECEVEDFRRELNMKEGYLLRTFTAKMKSGRWCARSRSLAWESRDLTTMWLLGSEKIRTVLDTTGFVHVLVT